ncbi:MAG: ribosome maturation factor RimP [Deltaproteobacteria bacterium]|nr:MAG: ribosome maturation factor RimP [Deltaproteobacteria bacterium]
MGHRPENVEEDVIRLIEPVVEDLGLELVDVEYVTERGRWILRIYIDKTGGVTVDDCALVSNEIGDLIDVKDIIAGHYVLEVSSPGLNRPLRKEKDFIWATGKRIKVRTKMPVEGRRNFTGLLRSCQKGVIRLDLDSGEVELPLGDLEKANLVYPYE